ncbi:hypothetical protein [Dermatophilus congolensis]|nr:hypothetical protein [Dermatophilus congolensis]
MVQVIFACDSAFKHPGSVMSREMSGETRAALAVRAGMRLTYQPT